MAHGDDWQLPDGIVHVHPAASSSSESPALPLEDSLALLPAADVPLNLDTWHHYRRIRAPPAGMRVLQPDDPELEVARRVEHSFKYGHEKFWNGTLILVGHWQTTQLTLPDESGDSFESMTWVQQCQYLSPGSTMQVHGEWTDCEDDLILSFNCRWPDRQELHPCRFRRKVIRAGQVLEPEGFFGEDDKGYRVDITHLRSSGLFAGGWRDIALF